MPEISQTIKKLKMDSFIIEIKMYGATQGPIIFKAMYIRILFFLSVLVHCVIFPM